MVSPSPLGWKFLPVETEVMPLLAKPKEGHFDVKEDPGGVTDTETSVGIGGASRNRKRHCPKEGLFHPSLSSFGLSGSFPPPGSYELEGESFCQRGQEQDCWFGRWLGLNFQISDFMKGDQEQN